MPAINDFSEHTPQIDGPATHAAVVTPNDGADLAHVTRALYFSAAGDVSIDLLGGETAVVFTVIAGGRLDVMATRVRATATTVAAGKIVALW